MGAARAIALVACMLCAASAASAGDGWLSWDEVEMEEPGAAEPVATALAAELMAGPRAEYARALAAASGPALARVREIKKKLEDAMAAARFEVGTGSGSGSAGSGGGGGISHGGSLGAAVDLQGLVLGGLLQFVERRASEEAVHWVLELMRTRLCDNGDGTRALFPATCGLLDGLAKVAPEMSPLALLRDAVRRDLSEMPQHMLAAAAALGPAAAPFRCGLGLAVSMDRLVTRGAGPDKITAAAGAVVRARDCGRALGFASRADAERATTTLRPAVDLVAAVLVESGATAVERDAALALDTAAREPLLPEAVTTEASGVDEEVADLRQLIDAVIGADEVPPALLKTAKELDAQLAEVENGFASTTAALEKTYAAAVVGSTAAAHLAIHAVAGPAGGVAIALRELRATGREPGERRDLYIAAIHASAALTGALFAAASPSVASRAIVDVAGGAGQLRAGDHAAGFSALVSSGLWPDREPFGSAIRLSELLIGIAGATNTGEMAEHIEAAAPRPRGWQRKRKRVTLGLGAQFGLAGGPEWALAGDSHRRERGTALEVFIPIGFDLAGPLGSHSIGLLLQVLDLGAVSSLRFGGDEEERRAELELTSVFAPGGLVYLGLGQTPFTLSVGASYVAALRERDDGSHADVVRAHVGLAVDLPLFAF
jgi:hypothetical protein